jgi:hypothetical protein
LEGRRPRRPQVTYNDAYWAYLDLVMPRVKFPSRPSRLRMRDGGALPHWDLEEGLYFVTFLTDSLPASFFEKFPVRTPVGP